MHGRAGKRRRAVGSSRQRGLARVVGGVAGAHSRLHPPSAGGAKNSAGIRAAQIGNRRIGPRGGAVRSGLRPPRDYRTADEAPTRLWRALFDRIERRPRCRRTRRPAGARPAFAGDDRAVEAPAAAAAARLGSRRSCAIGLGRRHCGLWRGACARHRRVAGARPSGLGGRIERRRAICACLVSARCALVLRQRGCHRFRHRRRRVVLSAAPRAAAPRLRARDLRVRGFGLFGSAPAGRAAGGGSGGLRRRRSGRKPTRTAPTTPGLPCSACHRPRPSRTSGTPTKR